MIRKQYFAIQAIIGFICMMLMQAAFAVNIDKIVAFGDSLSDNGNIYALTKKLQRVIPLIPIIPKNPPYYNGRFSNGPVWIEDVAVALDVPLLDYAYGGSWAEPLTSSGLVFPFSLSNQVNMYMTSHMTDYNQKDHLFIIWSGVNDYLIDRDDHEYATDNTIANIKRQIDWLIYYGGQNFVIPNLPDISISPSIMKEGPASVQSAYDIIIMHNTKLQALIEQEKKDHPDVTIIAVDVTKYMGEVISHPEKYNIKNMTDSCYGGGYWFKNIKADENELAAAKQAHIDFDRSPALRIAYMAGKLGDKGALTCKNPDEYMFWDELHPTRSMHMLIAKYMLEAIQDGGVFGGLPDKLASK